MKYKKLSGALMASLMIHTAIVLLAGAFWVTKTPQLDDSTIVAFMSKMDPPKPRIRGLVMAHMISAIGEQPSPRSARRPILPMQAVSHYQPTSVMEFSSPAVRMEATDAESSQIRRHMVVPSASNYSPRNTPASTEVVAKIRLSSGTEKAAYRRAPQLKPPNAAAYPDMYFKSSGVNPFLDTEDEHLSTFAMDVDTASYSITRRYLTEGHLPPSEAVRVEEFVNAFKCDYADPAEGAFAIHLEGAPSIFADSKRTHLLRIGLKGRVIPDENRKDATLTFVVDVSGSMERENRLGLVKKALTLLIDKLRPTDKVGIVVYGSQGRLVLPHTGVNRRAEILAAIDSLYPDGSTNAEEGLRIGYDLAWRNAEVDHINRVILCSDGVANVGQTGPEEILKEIRAHVKRGVTLSTVGFGMGNYNDILMEKLANAGNGNYAYVDTLSEARRIFVEDLTGTLQVIAKDAKIQVDFNPEVVSRFRLLGYENRFLENHQFPR